jgi:hypothetical protein
MRYFITKGHIDMVIKEWPDEWRISSITLEVLERKLEGEATQSEIHPPKIPVPKKLSTG